MSVIDDYLATVSSEQKAALEHVRKTIQATAPDATEAISYGMPAFKYKGKYLVGFCQFKDHLSIFPGGEIVEMLGEQLQEWKTSKGTIQFTLEKPLPDTLIEDIVGMRITAIEG